MAFFAQTTSSFCINLIRTLVFEKNDIFSAENWQKSQKIVIITSVPAFAAFFCFRPVPLFTFFNTQTRCIKSQHAQQHCHFFPKNVYPGGIQTRVPGEDAMSTSPRRQEQISEEI
jgi:hypothetical protein